MCVEHLFDTLRSMSLAPLQTSLFASGSAGVGAAGWMPDRTHLDELCWVDHAPRWLNGADELLLDLIAKLPFHQGTRLMWDNWVTEPRLTCTIQFGDPMLPGVVDDIASALSTHYDSPFDQLFTNYYRSGADSVAWHSDRIGRQKVDPLIAIVSLGGPRTLQLRPKGGGGSARFPLASGDLLVMGGATQHGWEHAITKVAHASPRISLTFRQQHSAFR